MENIAEIRELNYEEIIDFCKSHGAEISILGDEPLTDYGSAVVVG